LTGNNVDDAAIKIVLVVIDLFVIGDDFFGKLEVSANEGLGGLVDGITHHVCEVNKGLGDAIEFFLEYRTDESHWAKVRAFGE
jgi:hypothetical protein